MGLFSRKKIKNQGKKKVDGKTIKDSSGRQKGEKLSAKASLGERSMKDLYTDTKSAPAKKAEGQADASLKYSAKDAKLRGRAYRVLIRPIVTEKASILGAENKYVFEVSKGANKIETAKAINEVYGIKPVSVNIIKMKGKRSRYGRIAGKRKDWKKAVVTLPAGKSIKLYEGV